jgi:streptogramin lyase
MLGKMGFEGDEFPSKVGDDRSLPNPLISVVLTIMLAFLVSACGRAQIDSDSECIPPPVNLAFPVGATEVPGAEPEEIFPTDSWKAVADLPDLGSAQSLVARDPNEIWLTTGYDAWLYRTDTGEWTSYTTIDGLEVRPGGFCLAQNGTLWGLDFKTEALGLETPRWSRYNEVSGQFEFVRDQQGILSGFHLYSQECNEDQNGVFWVIAQDRYEHNHTALVSFDPSSLLATRHLLAPSGSYYADLAIGPDGVIWIADGAGQLIRYDPTTGEASPYEEYYVDEQRFLDDPYLSREALSDGFFNNLYFDRSNRLWIQDRGWLDFSTPDRPVWHQIVQSAVFIDSGGVPDNQYRWLRPYRTYQSSNGLFWFSAPAGMVRLDPESGEWCRFTTDHSPIAEDEDHNLWMAVFSKLYKYDLEP